MSTPQTIKNEPQRYFYLYEEIPDEQISAKEIEPVNDSDEILPPFLDDPSKETGFWAQKFSGEYTTRKKVWDIAFSVFLPMLCFVFDPVVFRDGFDHGKGMLHSYMPFAYSLAAVTIVASLLFHIFGARLRAFNPAFAGLFAAAGIVSLVIGMIILPITLIGSLVLIGIPGFTPWFSAFTMFRMSYRAMRDSEPFIERPAAINLLFLTGLTSIILPYLLNVEVVKLFVSR